MITNTPITSGTITAPNRVFASTTTGLVSGTGQTSAVTSLILCNLGTPNLTDETIESATVNIHLVKASASATPTNLIVSNLTVPAGETVFFSDERIILDENDSIYVGSTAGTTDTAGAFITGRLYVIETSGTTDYTLIGAANNTAGTTFVATGVGSGTGTARRILITTTTSSLPV